MRWWMFMAWIMVMVSQLCTYLQTQVVYIKYLQRFYMSIILGYNAFFLLFLKSMNRKNAWEGIVGGKTKERIGDHIIKGSVCREIF